MKVHPGMLMKTRRGRFQVSGARCQVPGVRDCTFGGECGKPRLAGATVSIMDNLHGDAHCLIWKMKVHPAMLMKTRKGRLQVSGARCQGSIPNTSHWPASAGDPRAGRVV